MRKYKMRVCGYKEWKWINHGKYATIDGKPVSVDYEIEANSYQEAEDKAIKDFESRGYFFDEIDISSINYIDEVMKDDIL